MLNLLDKIICRSSTLLDFTSINSFVTQYISLKNLNPLFSVKFSVNLLLIYIYIHR